MKGRSFPAVEQSLAVRVFFESGPSSGSQSDHAEEESSVEIRIKLVKSAHWCDVAIKVVDSCSQRKYQVCMTNKDVTQEF